MGARTDASRMGPCTIRVTKGESKPMKKISIREIETLKTTAAFYGSTCVA
jgi:hypothetical protein